MNDLRLYNYIGYTQYEEIDMIRQNKLNKKKNRALPSSSLLIRCNQTTWRTEKASGITDIAFTSGAGNGLSGKVDRREWEELFNLSRIVRVNGIGMERRVESDQLVCNISINVDLSDCRLEISASCIVILSSSHHNKVVIMKTT
jgi:hypothetical protein